MRIGRRMNYLGTNSIEKGSVFHFLKSSFQEHLPLIVLAFIYAVLALGTLAINGLPLPKLDINYTASVILIPTICLLFYFFGLGMHHLLHVRPLTYKGITAEFGASDVLSTRRIFHILFPALIIPFFGSIFTALKNAIPHINPFCWDQRLMEIDRWFHFGHHPFELLHPFLGSPLAISFHSYLYNTWFFVMFGVLWFQIVSFHHRILRLRYLASFILTWAILGSLLALVFSSSGPIFYEHFVTGQNPFYPLITAMQESAVHYKNWSLAAKSFLWENFSSNKIATGGGISAMPSLHVGIATLQALWAWQVSKNLGWIFTAYWLVILLGSVSLGWHYAIDGYASIVIVCLIWWGTGNFVERYQAMKHLQDMSAKVTGHSRPSSP